jgi:hypothetical protein
MRGFLPRNPNAPAIGTLLAPEALGEKENARSHWLHYTAVLGGVEAFSAALWQLAVQQAVIYSGYLAFTADGASWIWRLAMDLFPTPTQIVHWYHACHQLAEAASARFPNAPDQAQCWLKRLKTHLWQGELHQIIAQLAAAGLPTHYFEEHQHRMDYPRFNSMAYPVGSGTIESGVKQYKQRLCGTGMRWSHAGLARMICLRSTVLEDSFDARCAAAV